MAKRGRKPRSGVVKAFYAAGRFVKTALKYLLSRKTGRLVK